MPKITAEYNSELKVNKLLMQAATYTIDAQGENNIKYAVDTTLTGYDDSNGILLSAETEITVSAYITFVSDKGYMLLNISTEDTGIVFGTVQTKEEKTEEDIANLASQTADIANKLPPDYLGQIATNCQTAMTTLAANTPQMSRSVHFARDIITAPQIVIPTWSGANEAGIGSTVTITASIEYPDGVFTQVKFNGESSILAESGVNVISDATPLEVAIPYGEKFFVRIFMNATNGKLIYTNNSAAIDGNGFEFSTGKTDKTMGGDIAASVGGPMFQPCAIIGQTNKPSIGIIGDSRVVAGVKAITMSEKNIIEPSLGQVFPYLNLGESGSQTSQFISNNTRKMELLTYCSHIVCSYGINDFMLGSLTANQVAADLATVTGYFTDKKIYLCTLSPQTTSTDSWTTVGNQTVVSFNAERILLNDKIRKNEIANTTSFFDIAKITESSYNSGLWNAEYTTDGLHESQLGCSMILSASAINPALFSR